MSTPEAKSGETKPRAAPAPSLLARPEPLPDDAPHVLVVDDDTRLRDLLAIYLRKNGFRVTTAGDAAAARACLRSLAFDLLILDVMMPGESGLDLARGLKAISDVPIVLLTARADPANRIEGLEAGVDEFVSKPYEPRELVLRIQNILRRQSPPPPAATNPARDEVKMGNCVFTISKGELKRGEEIVKLTDREKDLMRLFAQRANQPIARHELTLADSTGSERAVDVQITRLRRKLETDPTQPVYLQTARGKGYILRADG